MIAIVKRQHRHNYYTKDLTPKTKTFTIGAKYEVVSMECGNVTLKSICGERRAFWVLTLDAYKTHFVEVKNDKEIG